MPTSESGIEWTDRTWNVVRGCKPVSPGCLNCYATRDAVRTSGPGGAYEGLVKRAVKGARGEPWSPPKWTGNARFIPELLDAPLRWREPRRIFVNSMSDLFHEDISNEQIVSIFGVMAAASRHTFQVLTKRPERMLEWFAWLQRESEGNPLALLHVETAPLLGDRGREDEEGLDANDRAMEDLLGADWPLPNVWLGVSVEDQQRADERIPLLLETLAAVRFLSVEPMLEAIDLQHVGSNAGSWNCLLPSISPDTIGDPRRIDWVIVGGESGPGARPCDLAWIRSIVAQCKRASVPLFVKQLGSRPNSKRASDAWHGETRTDGSIVLFDRKGGDPDEWPEDLRIREFPR